MVLSCEKIKKKQSVIFVTIRIFGVVNLIRLFMHTTLMKMFLMTQRKI